MVNNVCTTCGKPIHLSPSAEKRAKRYGGTPQSYIDLFTQHTACTAQEVFPPQLDAHYLGASLGFTTTGKPSTEIDEKVLRSAHAYPVGSHPHNLWTTEGEFS